MNFLPLAVHGAFQVDIEPSADARGYFARTWCADEAAKHGIDARFVQSSVSHNKARGTLRGLHFQRAPHAEAKLVRCLRGSLFDVLVDVRPRSPTFRRWASVNLTGETMRAVFIPEGVAHGFMTLSDDTMISYDISTAYCADAAAGVRWNDPDLAIAWPQQPFVMTERDANFPYLADMSHDAV